MARKIILPGENPNRPMSQDQMIATRMKIFVDDVTETVAVQFGRLVEGFALPADNAIALGKMLQDKGKALKKLERERKENPPKGPKRKRRASKKRTKKKARGAARASRKR